MAASDDVIELPANPVYSKLPVTSGSWDSDSCYGVQFVFGIEVVVHLQRGRLEPGGLTRRSEGLRDSHAVILSVTRVVSPLPSER